MWWRCFGGKVGWSPSPTTPRRCDIHETCPSVADSVLLLYNFVSGGGCGRVGCELAEKRGMWGEGVSLQPPQRRGMATEVLSATLCDDVQYTHDLPHDIRIERTDPEYRTQWCE